ncbi:uncharacterized protein [Montipora foliosa]|uniref:uncharacterized protein n=1 Tax=Montipora foliosa TaxID=591990 RepID=UPI0035F1C6F7
MVQKRMSQSYATDKVADGLILVAIFLTLFEISIANVYDNGFNRYGFKVCEDSKSRQIPNQIQVSMIAYQTYKTRCGLFGWSRCKRSRPVTLYRYGRAYKTRWDVYLRCCKGWKQRSYNSRECREPICDRGCNNNGSCVSPNICQCRPGWTGFTCSKDSDECYPNKGGCEQDCINRKGETKPLCACKRGYLKDPDNEKKCIEIDECKEENLCTCSNLVQGNPCQVKCINKPGGFSCSCGEGYHLRHRTVCTDNNECAFNNGGCSHYCLNMPGSYHCECPRGFRLDANLKLCRDVNECEDNNGNCQHTCRNVYGRHRCSCREGFVLDSNKRTCSDIDECELGEDDCDHSCENNPLGGYRCYCDKGYKLSSDNTTCIDVDECSLRKTSGSDTAAWLSGCHHNCFNFEGGFECSCRNGYMLMYDRKRCQDIDECTSESQPCEQICLNTDGSYRCSCRHGFVLAPDGRFCEALPCEKILPPRYGKMSCSGLITSATCTFSCNSGYDLVGSTNRTCLPNSGWSGTLAMCKAKQCPELTTMSLEQTVSVPCFSSFGSTCHFGCRSGFFMQGDGHAKCSLNSKGDEVSWSIGQFSCEEIRICHPSPCKHGGKCLVTDRKSFTCICSGTGYKGKLCQTGVISTPIFPKLHTKMSSGPLFLMARPSYFLQVSLFSNEGLKFDPPSLELQFSKVKAEFVVKTEKPGIHSVSYSVDGESKGDFQTPQRSVVLVTPDFFDRLPRDTLLTGCKKHVSKQNAECEMRLLSTSPWIGAPVSTSGIVHLVTPNNVSVPMSLVGLNLEDLDIPRDRLINIAIAKTVSQGVFKIWHQANGTCLSRVSNTDNLLALMWSNAFPSSFMQALTEIAPEWLQFTIMEDSAAFDIQNIAVNLSPDSEHCSGFPYNDASVQVFYRPAINYIARVAGQEVALFADGATCFAVDICQSAMILNLPNREANVIKNSLNLFRNMGAMGINMNVESVGIFNKMKTSSFVKRMIWNGVKLTESSSFHYNMWLKGSLEWKMETQTRSLFVKLKFTGEAFIKYRGIDALFVNAITQPLEVHLNGKGVLNVNGRALGKDLNMTLSSVSITGTAFLGGEAFCGKSVQGLFLTSKESVHSLLNQSPLLRYIRPNKSEPLQIAILVSLRGRTVGKQYSVETSLQGMSLHLRTNLCLEKLCFNDLITEIHLQDKHSCFEKASSVSIIRARGKVLKTLPSSSDGNILAISRHQVVEILFPQETERVSVNFEANVHLFNVSHASNVTLQDKKLWFEMHALIFQRYLANVTVIADTSDVQEWSALRFVVRGSLTNTSQLSKFLQTKVTDLVKYLADKAVRKVRRIENSLLQANQRVNLARALVIRKKRLFNITQREKQRKNNRLQKRIKTYKGAKISLNSSLVQFFQLKNTQMCEYQNCSYIATDSCVPTICQDPINSERLVTICEKKTDTYVVHEIETTEEEEIEQIQRYYLRTRSNCGRLFDFFTGCDSYREMVPGAVEFKTHKVLRHTVKEKEVERVIYNCKREKESVISSYDHSYKCCSTETREKIEVVDPDCVSYNLQCKRNMSYLRDVIKEERDNLSPAFESMARKAQNVVVAQLEMSKARTNFEFADIQLKVAQAILEQHEHAKNSINITTVRLRERLGLKLAQKLKTANDKPLVTVDTIKFSVSMTKRATKTRFPATVSLKTQERTDKLKLLEFPMDFANVNRSLIRASRLIIEALFGSPSSRRRRSLREGPISSSGGRLDETSLSMGQRECLFSQDAHVYFSDVLDSVELFINNSRQLEDGIFTSLRGIEKLDLQGISHNYGPLEEIQSVFNDTLQSIERMFLSISPTTSWKSSLQDLRAFLDVSTKAKNFSECSGIQDCVGFFFDSLGDMYEMEDHPRAIEIKHALKELEISISRILNEGLTMTALESVIFQAKAFVVKSKDDIILCSKKPRIKKSSPVKVATIKGETIQLLCEAVSPIELLYVWYKNGEPLEDTNSTRLVLSNVTRESEGVYHCKVSNSRGSTMSNITIVEVHQKPQITEQPQGAQVFVGEGLVLLVCNSIGIPRPLTEWFFIPIKGGSSGHVVNLNSTKPVLVLHNLASESTGLYYCNVSNRHETVQSRNAKLDVLDFAPGVPRIAVKFGLRYCKASTEPTQKSSFSAASSFWKNLCDVLGWPTGNIDSRYFHPFPNASISFVLKGDDAQVPGHDPPAKRRQAALNNFSLSRVSMVKRLRTLYTLLTNGSFKLEMNEKMCFKKDSFSIRSLPQRCSQGTRPHENGFLCVNCAPGYYEVGNRTCLKCPSGTYQSEEGQTECIKCPFRRSFTATGAFTLSQCIDMSSSCRPPSANTKTLKSADEKKQLYRTGDIIQLKCEKGYKGVGNSTIECNEGNWTSDFYCRKTCLPPWTEFSERCYRVTASRLYTWKSALAKCQTLQSHMLTIHSEEENNFAATLVKAYLRRNNLTQAHMWLGLFKSHARGEFQWVDGSSFGRNYSNWSPGEPNNVLGRELCTEMLLFGRPFTLKKWNDIRCDTTQYKPITVCEKPMRTGD